MSRSGRVQNLAASPTLVGAVTVLIAIVAVFLAYNANQGLPFVPTYRISATVPNANTLVPGNEVRIGGVRVGTVEEVNPVQDPDTGDVHAKLDLTLQRDIAPIPDDSTVVIRSRSALGLKYLQITKGNSSQGYAEGSTIPLTQARPEPVEIDEVLSTFDDPTRKAIQVNLREFGDTLAGRGGDLNQAIHNLRPLTVVAIPAMRNLASPATDLSGFVNGLSNTAAEVAPVAEQQADLFVSLDVTFGALADVAPSIQQTIIRSPGTEDTAIRVFPRVRPFFRHTATLFENLQPGSVALRQHAAVIADSVVIGVKALRDSPAFNAQLPPTAQSLLDLANDASARQGIDDLTTATLSLDPALNFIAPAQSVCNYATLLFRNTQELLSVGNSLGTYQRFTNFNPFGSSPSLGTGPNNIGVPASAPANGPGAVNFLHYNPYPNTAAPNQTFECEAGNEKYASGQKVIGNVPGNQGIHTEDQTKGQLNSKKKK